MNLGFWIGLAVAIPLSIIANLFTPKIQYWWDKRNKKETLQRTKRLREEYQRIEAFFSNREEFREYMLYVIIKTTYIGSVIGIFTGLSFILPRIIFIHEISGIVYSFGQLLSVFGALMIVKICSSAIRDFAKVRNFAEYKKFVSETLGGLGTENEAEITQYVPTDGNKAL